MSEQEGVKVKIGGMEIEVCEVGSAKIVEVSRQAAKKLYLENLYEVAEGLKGPERTRLLLASAKQMDWDGELEAMSAEWRGTMDGFLSLLKLACVGEVDRDELKQAVAKSTEAEIKHVSAIIKGGQPKKKAQGKPE